MEQKTWLVIAHGKNCFWTQYVVYTLNAELHYLVVW